MKRTESEKETKREGEIRVGENERRKGQWGEVFSLSLWPAIT
jgi:hypothetical protein